jgi:hypothetical protein
VKWVSTEGARDVKDLEPLRALGIHYAQCYILGQPKAAWVPGHLELPFSATVAGTTTAFADA